MGTGLSRRVKQRHASNNDDDRSSTDGHFFEELVPERYLVLLTEQMSEILFRLLTEKESDRQIISSLNINDDERTNTNSINEQSLLKSPIISRSCMTCRMKILTIEEFRQLHQAFYRVDSDDDQLLTRDEIRMTLQYLFKLTESDMEEFLVVFDINQDKRVSLEEYIDEMKHRLLHEYTREEIKRAFDQADLQKNGHLDSKELTKAIDYLNLHLSPQRIVEIVNDLMQDKSTDTIDFMLFTNLVQTLHRREPITLEKLKSIRSDTLPTTTSSLPRR